MRFNIIRMMDVSNGPGIRVSIFTQGCNHHCKNCFNQETWDENGGEVWKKSINDTLIELSNNNIIQGLSILGGEPFFAYKKEKYDITQDMLLSLVMRYKERYPQKSIWLWTGYQWEDFFKENNKFSKRVFKVLKYLDVIVDGPFMEEKKNITLPYAGSENQRVINVQETLKTLKKNKIVLM